MGNICCCRSVCCNSFKIRKENKTRFPSWSCYWSMFLLIILMIIIITFIQWSFTLILAISCCPHHYYFFYSMIVIWSYHLRRREKSLRTCHCHVIISNSYKHRCAPIWRINLYSISSRFCSKISNTNAIIWCWSEENISRNWCYVESFFVRDSRNNFRIFFRIPFDEWIYEKYW